MSRARPIRKIARERRSIPNSSSSFEVIELMPGTPNFKIVKDHTKLMIDEWMRHLGSMKMFNMHVYSSCINYAHLLRLLRYNVGSSIHPHTDWMDFVHASCTINLNDSYEGGEFAFFNGQLKFKLGVGDALIFPADTFWVHEVKEITEGVRYSTNTFLMSIPYQRALEIRNYRNAFTNENSPFKF